MSASRKSQGREVAAAAAHWSGDIQVEFSFPGTAEVPPVMHEINSVLRIVTWEQWNTNANLRAMFLLQFYTVICILIPSGCL